MASAWRQTGWINSLALGTLLACMPAGCVHNTANC